MNEYWGLLAQFGLWGWIASVIFLIQYSFPGVDAFRRKSAIVWGVISIIFFSCWITGMILA